MAHPLATAAAAIGVFAGTNVDDLIILTVLFLSSRAVGKPAVRQIWAGQYAGIATLVAVSALAALGLTLIPDDKVHLLGIVPFGLGLWSLIKAFRAESGPGSAVASSAIAIAGVTIANGADNIAVYTPLMRTMPLPENLLTVAIFAILVAVWVAAASWLGSHPRVVAPINRYGHWIVPIVFITIGILILAG